MKSKTIILIFTFILGLFFLGCKKEAQITNNEDITNNSIYDVSPAKSIQNNQKVLGDTCYADTASYNDELPTCVDTVFMTNNKPLVEIQPYPNSEDYEVTYVSVAPIDPISGLRIMCRSMDKGTVFKCAKLYVSYNVFGCCAKVEGRPLNDGTGRKVWEAFDDCDCDGVKDE